jgi:LuxR family maltose regulon positive regulatory protein
VDDEISYKRELEHTSLARVLVALGRAQPGGSHTDDALNLLARLLEAAETAGWMGKAIEILVLQALALQVRGAEEEALTALNRALSIAEPEGYVRTFVDEGAPMVALLRRAVPRGIAPNYVSKLLTASEVETKDERRKRLLRHSSFVLRHFWPSRSASANAKSSGCWQPSCPARKLPVNSP